MTRIQILELPPEPTNTYHAEDADGRLVMDDPKPRFVIVLDQYTELPDEHEAERLRAFRELCGACAMFVSTDTIDIPANDHTAYAATGSTPNAPLVEPVRIMGDGDAIAAYLAAMNGTAPTAAADCPDCHCPACDHPHPRMG